MRKTILAFLGCFGLITGGLSSPVMAARNTTKGVKKICPDGSVIPYKQTCPDYTPPDPIPDPDPTPTGDPASLVVSDVSVNEAAGNVTVTVTKTNTTSLDGTFGWSTSGGTATSGVDFSARSGSLTISSARTTATFTVPILNDTADESDETFTVSISAGTNSTISDGSATVSIVDDDVPVTPPSLPSALTITDAQVNESAGTVTITVSRAGNNSSLAAGFSYATSTGGSAGTATASSDYTTTSGSSSISAGATTASFTIPIISDILDEADETFTVSLTAGSNATLSDGTATVTILDDDTTPIPDPPAPTVGDELAESLEGLTFRTVSDHDYLTSLQASWGSGKIPPDNGTDVVGAFRQVCGANQKGYFDPVVYPGQDGKSHLHDFNGHKGVNASSTFTTLMSGGASSCNYDPLRPNFSVQRSIYWIPGLEYNTQLLRVNYVTVYYKRRPKSDPLCGMPTGTGAVGTPEGICTEIPNGLKMVTGSKMVAGSYGPTNIRGATQVTSAVTMYYLCATTGIKYETLADLAAGSPTCQTLSINVPFPDCWDGKYLWKTDRDHVRYKKRYTNTGQTKCEPSHPYSITGVTLHYNYNISGLDLTKLKLASDYMDPTQPAGWSLHADLLIAWDARVKRMFHDNCIDRHLNCSGGDLGNGLQLKGAAQPEYGWNNPNRFEDIPPMPDNMVMP